MEFKFWLQENFLVRTLVKPWMDFKHKKGLRAYQKSSDSQYIKTFKNKYKGERCFILGNGPSLKIEDLDSLINEYTFAANRIYNVFGDTKWRPSFYLSVDPNVLRHSIEDMKKLELNDMFLSVDLNSDLSSFKSKATHIYEYTKFKINKWIDKSAHISEDVSQYFSVGYTVTFTAIQFAIYMGFKEIYLLGVDFSYSRVRDKNGKVHSVSGVKDYFYKDKYYADGILAYDSNLYAYQVAKEYADAHGIKIFNATRGGKLEVFERVDFDSIIKK